MSTKKLLGILVPNAKTGRALLALYRRHNPTGLKLICFTLSDIDWKRRRVTALHRRRRRWAHSKFPLPRVIYNRCYKPDPLLLKRLEAEIGAGFLFNGINRLDKMDVHRILSPALAPHLPDSEPHDEASADRLLDLHRILYFKPIHGSRGIGVFRAELKASGEIHLGNHYLLPSHIFEDRTRFHHQLRDLLGSSPCMVQSGIPALTLFGQYFDIRVLVQKNGNGEWTVTSAVSRIAAKGCFNTSIAERVVLTADVLKTVFLPERAKPLLAKIKAIGAAAAERLDEAHERSFGELSVDLALDRAGHPWIIEVNGMPQKSLYSPFKQSKRAAYEFPLLYASHLLTRSSSPESESSMAETSHEITEAIPLPVAHLQNVPIALS